MVKWFWEGVWLLALITKYLDWSGFHKWDIYLYSCDRLLKIYTRDAGSVVCLRQKVIGESVYLCLFVSLMVIAG